MKNYINKYQYDSFQGYIFKFNFDLTLNLFIENWPNFNKSTKFNMQNLSDNFNPKVKPINQIKVNELLQCLWSSL